MKAKTALLLGGAVIILGSLTGCFGTPSTKIDPSALPTSPPPATGIRPPTPGITVSETIRAADSPRTLSSPEIMVAETIRLNDSSRMLAPVSIVVTETLRVNDSPAVVPGQTQPSPPPPQQVTVVVGSPKTGEVWRAGNAQNVAWTTTGSGIDHVDIYYSTDGGKSMIAVARGESNYGSYTWKVPNTPSKTVLVRVLAFGAKGETLASGDSGLFTISTQ